MGQPVVSWQIITKNPDRTNEFYTKLFGWKTNTDNALGYRMIDTGSERGINGGIWPAPPQANSFVQLFIEVEDMAGYVEKATKLGAKVRAML
jgi:predicted enzyme related to lactoylglutathione lyase